MMVRWPRKRKPCNLIYAIQYSGQINQIQATRAAFGNEGRFFLLANLVRLPLGCVAVLLSDEIRSAVPIEKAGKRPAKSF
jgi:hypothetical protein